ncbi:hypothetical protein ACFQ9Q_30515 [Streptomyces virginiae]|uniref:hypothetical protein n=1 Tax=Streptomyces virginiae TaxID=1961 RepID=UPI00367850CB
MPLAQWWVTQSSRWAGGFIQPTGKKFSINMVTVGIWNKDGVMQEEFLFWDNNTFYKQLGLA